MNVKLIGTNHLLDKKVVEDMIRNEAPDIIGIELCEFREAGILDGEVAPKIDEKPKYLLDKITSKIEKKAEKEGLDYGSDMKAALNYSIENNIPRVLVDMPILKIQDLFSKIPIQEQEGFQRELGEFENESVKKEVKEEEVLLGMKQRYPIAFEFLINMRNLYIANQILRVVMNNPGKKVVVVLGSSHVKNVNMLIGN